MREIQRGSESNRPVAAAQRQALNAAVLPSVVGPNAQNLCSPKAEVVVPLRSTAAGFGTRKLTIKTRATLYGGAMDKDALKLICLPAAS